MVNIKEVKTDKELKKFIMFPFKLYENSKYWVPPIISEEMKVFNPDKNPILKDAKVKLFLALKNNKIVGRIAGIINKIEVNEQKTKKMRFGWFDFIDDYSVSSALISKVTEIGIKNNLDWELTSKIFVYAVYVKLSPFSTTSTRIDEVSMF